MNDELEDQKLMVHQASQEINQIGDKIVPLE